MEKHSVSVVLADSCCSRNYLLSQVVGSVVWFRGRKFHWEDTGYGDKYDLYCNNRLVGDLYIDEILIYDEYSDIIHSESELRSLISMFNLFPL